MQTGPPTPTRTQPAFDDGWRKVTLTVPNGKTNNEDGGVGGGGGDLGQTPVAPPRRKRSSVIDRQPKPVGFKELFGSNVSRRSSCDSILKEENLSTLSEREQEMLQQKRKSKSISDFSLNEIKAPDSLTISTIRIPVTRTLSLMERAMVQQTTIPAPRPALQRKISRVGNKKSDKFFGENLSDCLSDDVVTPEPEPTSISFTYHTISTLITPIPHSQCVEFASANSPAVNDVDGNRTVYTSCIEPNEKTKPFTVSECVDARRSGGGGGGAGDRKSSLDKKAEFLMAMLEGTNSLPTSTTATNENNIVITPPRRSHLKKKQNIQLNENRTAVESIGTEGGSATESVIASHKESNALQNSQEKCIEKQSIAVANREVGGTKTEPKFNVIDNTGDDNNDMYSGMTPVEEPVIVPRRRITKHICDGDDHQHIKKHIDSNSHAVNVLHQNENKENEPNRSSNDKEIEQYIIQQVTQSSTPEKPKRDFGGVPERSNPKPGEHSQPTTPKTNANRLPGKPVPAMRVRHLSQDSLMPKTASTPPNGVGVGGADSLEPLKKYTSQQSFFTQDLLNQLSDRIYGFQDDPFDPSDTCDDGSAKCTPNSKLTTRKISVHRKESTVNRPILENDASECATIDSAPKIVQMEQKEQKPIIPSRNRSTNTTDNDNELNEKPLETTIAQPKLAIEQFILVERENSSVCDGKIGTNAIVTANAAASPSGRPQQEPTTATTAAAKTSANESESKCNIAIITKTSALAPLANTEDMSLELGNSSDDENTDSDTTVKTQLNNLNIEASTKADAKRDSIVDVDAWFLRHNSDLANYSRRSSESQVAYDTRKVFPFGQPEPGAGTAFFDTKTFSKSVENVLRDNKLTKIEPTAETTTKITTAQISPNDAKSDESTASKTDHSILLKYLK